MDGDFIRIDIVNVAQEHLECSILPQEGVKPQDDLRSTTTQLVEQILQLLLESTSFKLHIYKTLYINFITKLSFAKEQIPIAMYKPV